MSEFRPAEHYTPCDDLWVVTTYYNPARFRTKRANYERFAAPIRAAGIPFVTIECAFGDEPFELPASADLIQVRGRDVMWMKERLINLAIATLPASATKVAWLDADILFTNSEWAPSTSAALDRAPLAQPHECVGRMGRGQLAFSGKARRSFACQLQRRPESARFGGAAHGQPGIAWAARRDLIARHGLYDAAIIDGGDELFSHAAGGGLYSPCVRGISGMYIKAQPRLVQKAINGLLRIAWPRLLAQWYIARTSKPRDQSEDWPFFAHFLDWARPFFADVDSKVGCVPGMALHLWHGDPVNRQYASRNAVLARHRFDPATDLRPNADGLWEWASPKYAMHREVKEYFTSRREDG